MFACDRVSGTELEDNSPSAEAESSRVLASRAVTVRLQRGGG